MKKHVLVLGSGGMLGHVVNMRLRSLSNQFSVTDVARKSHILKPDIEMDISDFTELKNLFNLIKPDIIINCVGILNTNAENNPADAILLNSYLPHFLEKLTAHHSCRVIHISTDCVFSGKKGYYSEHDFMDADDYYGRSKALGEIQNSKDLTLRTSIVGPELHTYGIGLFQWFSKQSGVIPGYTQVFWTGITTIELSKTIVSCIQQDVFGLYHVVNGMRISKYDLLHYFKSIFPQSPVTSIKKNNAYQYDKSLVSTRTGLPYEVPSYEEMLLDMKSWISQHSPIYPHYKSIL
jgi:dTDP-4-dehydrorhamnose reductase